MDEWKGATLVLENGLVLKRDAQGVWRDEHGDAWEIGIAPPQKPEGE